MRKGKVKFSSNICHYILYLCLLLLATPTIAAEARYKNPKVSGYALDYCQTWGKNCGKPAANAFCRSKGYNRALRFHLKRNAPPTRIIGSGQICNNNYCGRIDLVICEAEVSFAHPKHRGYALDLCAQWGKNCGKPAANAFCKKRGYATAVDFAVRQNSPPTRVIGNNKICRAAYCDRIIAITCKNKLNKGPTPVICDRCDSAGETMTTPPDASEFADFDF